MSGRFGAVETSGLFKNGNGLLGTCCVVESEAEGLENGEGEAAEDETAVGIPEKEDDGETEGVCEGEWPEVGWASILNR